MMPSRYEGFALGCIEALASGCAFIGSDILSFGEILEQGRYGRLLDADQPYVWADEIERLLSDHDTLQRMAREGRRLAEERFTFDKCYAAYLRLYEEMRTHVA